MDSSADDYREVLHELKVHQAELEAQNHELRETRKELELALEKYESLFELAPVGYVTHDGKGRIAEANAAAAEIFGSERRAIRGSNLDMYCQKEDLPVLFSYLRRCRE